MYITAISKPRLRFYGDKVIDGSGSATSVPVARARRDRGGDDDRALEASHVERWCTDTCRLAEHEGGAGSRRDYFDLALSKHDASWIDNGHSHMRIP